MSLIGCVMDYGDAYIVCGVPILEWASYIIGNALAFTLVFVILMWLLIKWISLVTDSRRETVKSLRLKLICYASLACVVMFGVCWYTLVLADVTNDLKTMDKHADAAVETLNTYREQRDNLNQFLDEYYMTQCWLAGQVVTKTGRDALTRKDMQHYADDLNVKYIYAFDQRGRVVVTNSPYDHYSLSEDPADPSYEFRALLDGVYGVIQEPALDKRFDEDVQYVGMSLRNKEDLLMIAVDPALRNDLISPLMVETVLSNLIIGLPEHAIAVDKETLNIIATTGIGFKGASVEELGIRKENLTEDFSGFLKINGQTYYAGVSETAELYLVPIVRRTAMLDNLKVSLWITLCTAITSLIISGSCWTARPQRRRRKRLLHMACFRASPISSPSRINGAWRSAGAWRVSPGTSRPRSSASAASSIGCCWCSACSSCCPRSTSASIETGASWTWGIWLTSYPATGRRALTSSP